ncbi:MFS transporter [Vallitalea okinawensis]|uniref:MFS transporter n=1 Tax=Vallitalea okinawensis TaxID=2078660 RepID=UPI000CFAF9C9|nr:MFS transporter [Vallitalea okinawensis]
MLKFINKLFSPVAQYGGLPKSVYILFIARIINRMGGFVHMFLTLFLSSKLGMNEAEIGFYMLLLGIGGMCGPMVGGWLADHLGRKKVYIAAQGLAALLLIPCGFMGTSIYIVWVLIAFNFLGSMVRPVSSAMLTDLTPPERRKDAFSLLYLGINFGVAIGPMLAGFLFKDYLQWIFWGDALTTLIALALITYYIPETKPTEDALKASKAQGTGERAEEGSFMEVLIKRPLLLAFAGIGFFGAFVYAQHSFTIPLQLESLFRDEAATSFGYLMSFNAIVVLLFTSIVMRITRHIKPIYNMLIAYLFYLFGFGILTFADQYSQLSIVNNLDSSSEILQHVLQLGLFYISFFIWTMGEILATTNSGVYIANHSPISHRGRFNAIINIIMGAGFTIGPAITGLVLMSIDFTQFWLIIGAISGVTAFLAYLLGRYEESEKTTTELQYESSSK